MSYKEGFIQKQGKRKVQGYKKRWFVLNGRTIKYYASQEVADSNLLGVIDMAMVVSTKQNKHVKNGFEIIMPNRTYYLSTKAPEEREEWMKVIQNAAEEARKCSTSSSGIYDSVGLSNPSYSKGGDANSAYSLVGDSSHTYSSVGGESQQSNQSDSLHPAEYSMVGSPPLQSTSPNNPAAYSLVGGPSQSVSVVATYDEIPKRDQVSHINEPESIYDIIGASSPYTTKKLPLNDISGDCANDYEGIYDSASNLAPPSMSSFMSKLSMESLDSIDSLDNTDDENYDYDTDGDIHEGESNDTFEDGHIGDSGMLPESGAGEKFAADKIKDFFHTQGIQPSKDIDYAKIDKDHKLNLDIKAEFPAFDALKKFLVTCK